MVIAPGNRREEKAMPVAAAKQINYKGTTKETQFGCTSSCNSPPQNEAA